MDSDLESLNLSHTERSTPAVELPIPTKHPTPGRSLRDVVWHERSEDEMWLPYKNKPDFELAQWFIEAKVPKDHIDEYFKQKLGPEDSTLRSAYRLFDTVDQLESGMGMKSWKERFVSFSEAVSQCIRRTSHSDRKKELLDRDQPDKNSLRQRFFFRDPIECASYLLCQKCFAKDMVYAPVKESNGEESPH